jgi:hypothetical protein
MDIPRSKTEKAESEMNDMQKELEEVERFASKVKSKNYNEHGDIRTRGGSRIFLTGRGVDKVHQWTLDMCIELPLRLRIFRISSNCFVLGLEHKQMRNVEFAKKNPEFGPKGGLDP